MSAPGSPLADHLRRHLAALDAAGVRWVPKAGPPPALPVLPDVAEEFATPAGPHPLEVLAAEVAGCDRCPALFATRTRTVFGGGPVGAEVCFVADAPRADDEADGLLAGGPAGETFAKQLKAMGFERDEVYLCAAIKCRPPGNRPPRPDECNNCRGFLERQLDLVRPRAVCCLGPAAAQAVLGTTAPLQELRGKVHDLRGRPVVCTYHPAYVLENPPVKRACWDDLKLLVRTLGRTLPQG